MSARSKETQQTETSRRSSTGARRFMKRREAGCRFESSAGIDEPAAVETLPRSMVDMLGSHPFVIVGDTAFSTDVVVHVIFRRGMEHVGVVMNPDGWSGAIEHPDVSQVSEHIALYHNEL